jgi:hypothetical protein
MKTPRFLPTLFATALLMTVLMPQAAVAQEEPDMAMVMEAWTKAATPGEAHAFLARMEGEWTATVTMWMDPSGEPTVSEATSKQEMMMDGRYLHETTKGEFMGQPFHGIGFSGYNNVTEKYEGMWIDNMSTAVHRYEGEMEGDVLVYHGKYMDPVSGEWIKSRSTITMPSDDEIIAVGYETRDGVEVKVMELVYKRKT